MTISDLISRLQTLKDEHGDLEVHTTSVYGVCTLPEHLPEIRHLAILTGRERRQRYWYNFLGEEFKGQKVVAL